ncbi:hypothetical protein MMC13_000412 [Lambiella insularis]|nr:hypothetical protein [Lambiella insularis]
MPLTHTPSSHLRPTSPSGAQTSGMTRLSALSDLSPSICASLMIAAPHSASAIHHHGPQDTVVYARSGHGAIVTERGAKRQLMAPGDFALIPAWEAHQEVNEGTEECVWVIVRSGREGVVENLGGWGEEREMGDSKRGGEGVKG